MGGKPLKDTFEALGHAQAYDFMFTLLGEKQISEADILTIHRMLYLDIDKTNAGTYRQTPVIITGSKYPVCKAERIKEEITKLIDWASNERSKYHPIEFAALLHKKVVFIHPFIDGNGRISPLLMNTALLQDGYMLAIIPPVLRHEYIELLERAHKDDTGFIKFLGERVLDSEKEIIRLLQIV